MKYTSELVIGTQYRVLKSAVDNSLGGDEVYVYIGDGKVVALDGARAGNTYKPHAFTVWSKA